MSIHRVSIPRVENSLLVDFTPEDHTSPLIVFIRYNERPSETEYDLKITLSHNTQNQTNTSPHHVQARSVTRESPASSSYTLFVSRDHLKGNGSYFIGVLPAGGKETKRNYTFQAYSSGCYYWSETLGEWTSDGCEVGHPFPQLASLLGPLSEWK